MKKTMCLILAAVQMLLCLTACTGGWPWESTEPTEPVDTIVYAYKSEVPTYADDKEMPMIAFWSPPPTEEFYQGMVDCGFTDVIISNAYGAANTSTLLNILGICDKVGIGAYVSVGRDSGFNYVPSFGDYDCFKGINTDEPLDKNNLDTIAENIEKLHSGYPNNDLSYLTTLVYDATPEIVKDFGTYENYVEYYMQHGGGDEDAFMFDIYPLSGNSINGQINGRWLAALETLAATSKKYDVDLYSYLATMSIRSQTTRRPAEDDMRYVSYVNLAYGVKGFAYFCYMSPGSPPYTGEFTASDYALLYYEDVDDWSTYYKTPTWDIVKTVNDEMKSLEDVILSFEWQGVMKSIGSEATTSAGKNCFTKAKNWIKRHDGIKKFSSTEDAILGTFTDENGYDGFMLVNFADTLYNKENTVTLEFRGATRAVVYIQGEAQMVDLVDGTYTVTLQPGEGQFIIPLS